MMSLGMKVLLVPMIQRQGRRRVNEVERQRWLRIRLAIAAYAYEYLNISIMSDGEFDSLSLEVNLRIRTGNEKLDEFFEKRFDPSTGSWVHHHPEKPKLATLYVRYHA